MSKRTMALAAVLLVCGIGTASAQGQTQGQGSGQKQTAVPANPPGGEAVPLYRQQVPAVVPLGPHIDKPKVNPSAAGTIKGWEKPSLPGQMNNEGARQHSGSVGSTPTRIR